MRTPRLKRREARRRFDAFVSHSSTDADFAADLVRAVQASGLTAWLDNSELRYGRLLRSELQAAIADSRVVVLLWSEAASRSRWVLAELFTGFHLDHFIITCALDATPLPQFLGNDAYLERTRDRADIAKKLVHAIRDAPAATNQVAPLMAAQTPAMELLDAEVYKHQYDAVTLAGSDQKQAARANQAAERALKRLVEGWPLQAMALSLSGYQCKNTYMLERWDEIQAGRAPKDPLLEEAERYFFETLCFSPYDAGALNGLGSILFFERELDAAEFFQRRAIELVKRDGGDYSAAEEDLKTTLYYKHAQQA